MPRNTPLNGKEKGQISAHKLEEKFIVSLQEKLSKGP